MLFDGMFSPAAIGMNWTENVSNRIPYLGEGLFPSRKQVGELLQPVAIDIRIGKASVEDGNFMAFGGLCRQVQREKDKQETEDNFFHGAAVSAKIHQKTVTLPVSSGLDWCGNKLYICV